jgi:hypothetical protein
MNSLKNKVFFAFPTFLLTLGFALLVPQLAKAQVDPLWKKLGKISYETKMDEELDAEIMFPIFDENIKALDGKKVTIRGYVIPLEIGEDYFVISAYPFNDCFFCGAAGPETVMEVYLAEDIKLTEETVTLTGTLELNGDDIHHLMYLLRDARVAED